MVKKLPTALSSTILDGAGFTLIELLVTISLIGILFTVGIASYIDFSRRQVVFQAARKIVQDLRLTQSLAANNQKPQLQSQELDPDCVTLDGYTFNFSADNSYTISANCSGPTYNKEIKGGSILPPPDLNLSGLPWVKFKVLRQAMECSSGSGNPCELTVQDSSGHKKIIIVGSGGAINIEGE